jgi:hypothetical protein
VAGGAAALTLLTATGAHAEGEGDIRVTKAVVNHGKNVIVGTTKAVEYPIAITIKDDSGEDDVDHVGVHGHDADHSGLDPRLQRHRQQQGRR